MNLLNFFKPKTSLSIIECLPAGVRALVLQLEDNELTINRFLDWHSLADLAHFFKTLKLKKNSNVLFVYDHSLAATFAGFVKLEKNNFHAPISEDDLHTFLRAATQQFFNRFREEAKRHLELSEVDVVLANNRFLNLHLNGKPILNPLGETARFAELEMEQTYLSRSFWDDMHAYTEDISNVFHIELTGAVRDSLALLYPDRKVLLAQVFPHMTKVYSCGGKNRYFGAVSFPKVQTRGGFALGSVDLLQIFKTRFPIDEKTAEDLFYLYVGGGMSKHLKHTFSKLLAPYCTRFESEISKFFKKEDICVILSDIPFLTAGQTIQHKEASHITFSNLVSGLNLEVRSRPLLPLGAFSPVFLSGLIAYLHRTGDNYLSGLAKERMRWLTPENSV